MLCVKPVAGRLCFRESTPRAGFLVHPNHSSNLDPESLGRPGPLTPDLQAVPPRAQLWVISPTLPSQTPRLRPCAEGPPTCSSRLWWPVSSLGIWAQGGVLPIQAASLQTAPASTCRAPPLPPPVQPGPQELHSHASGYRTSCVNFIIKISCCGVLGRLGPRTGRLPWL